MSSSATFPPIPALPEFVRVARPAFAGPRARRKRLRILLFAIALIPCTLILPPVWQGAVRGFLTARASSRGYELTVERITGGPFDATRLEGVHLQQHGIDPAGDTGTDLTIAHARFAVAWRFPWLNPSAPWLQEIDLEEIRGRFEVAAESRRDGPLDAGPAGVCSWWLPANFVIQADDVQLLQHDNSLRMYGLQLTGSHDGVGEIAGGSSWAGGQGFTRNLNAWHGQTYWKDGHLTLVGLDLGGGVSLVDATLDLSQLGRRRLDWDCRLNAFGGDIRGQGAVDLAGRPEMEIAVTLHNTSVAPLAKMLGWRGIVAGRVEEGSFTFRGNPDDLASTQMWISARASGLSVGGQCWGKLDARAVVLNRRVQLRRFDLRQDSKAVSLAGDYPLAFDNLAGLTAATVRNLDIVLRGENGEWLSERSGGEEKGYLLAK